MSRDDVISFSLRSLKETSPGSGRYAHVEERADLSAAKTAAIICDMWDRHWCRGATRRVAEMAPRMNELVSRLRAAGAAIVHCPSGTMDAYTDHPARRRVLAAPDLDLPESGTAKRIQESAGPLGIEDHDGGCACTPKCRGRKAWSSQIAAIEIRDEDAIGDDVDVLRFLKDRGIEHVLIMGVHTNMCVLGRPFGIRNLVDKGFRAALVRDLTDTMYDPRMLPHVDHFTGTDLVVWHIERHWCRTITSDQMLGGAPFRFREDVRAALPVYKNYVTVPETDHHWKKVSSYVESLPHPDYDQAPEESREAFRDMKYGVRIHWGLYSIWNLRGESWPFLELPFDKKAEYVRLSETFNPTAFDAEGWMSFFERAGFRCFAFTSKHHEGFSMFHTKTRVRRRIDWSAPGGPRTEECDLAYSIAETPFGRDIVRELCDAGRRHGIKIDLYFSHPDWYDADFRPYNYHPLMTPDAAAHLIEGEFEANMANRKRNHVIVPPVSPDEEARMLARHRGQLLELLTRYGKLDMMCLDQWMGPTVWPHMRETMKMLRKLQPHIMFRCRGVGNYGDYYTPEGFVPGSKENTDMPWMVIHALGRSFSYDPEAAGHKGPAWVVTNLIDAVSKGGNFMVGIGPDASGAFHPEAVRRLEEVGRWVARNGEGIYGTRPRDGELYREGEEIRYTRSKDGRTVYAFSLVRPAKELRLRTVEPRPRAEVRMLGFDRPLRWTYSAAEGLVITLPEDTGAPDLAYGFSIPIA